MFYKTSIKAEVAAISHDNPDLGKKVIDVLRTVYDDAIKRAKKTGESIESITYEILEGLEEGLMSKHQDIEPVLKVAADTMVELIYDHAQENIRNSQIKKDLAQEHFKETIEKEKAHLAASMETFQLYAKDKELRIFEKKLHSIETEVSQKIEAIHNTFKRCNNVDV